MKIIIKKIAFLIPSLQGGGMERVMSEIIKYITSNHKDVECHLVLYGKNREISYEVPDSVIVYRPPFVFEDNKRQWMTIKTMKFIRNTVNKINPFSILSFGEYWNNLVLLSLLGTKYKIFVADRSSPLKNLGFIQEKMRSFLYRNAKGIIVQTNIAKDIYMKRQYNKNIIVIGNPIRNIESDFVCQRKKIILSVGRLITSKNFNRLIDIFSRIDDNEWLLIIVGGDSDKQKNSLLLKKQIDRLGLNNRVFLEGSQKNVEKYLLESSIFTFASASEGFPNVIGEAMSAGLPVVAFDCIAGPSDMLINGRNGYLIPLYDDDTFKERLEFLMYSEETRERMGARSKEDIKRFSIEKIGEQFINLLI